jgi:hypothetical protein
MQRVAPVAQRGLKFCDSRFDSVAWSCLSLCRDAEAMRIAVVVAKEKLRLPVISMFKLGNTVPQALQSLSGFVYILRRPVKSNALVVLRLHRSPRALV